VTFPTGSWGIRPASLADLSILEPIAWPPLLAPPRRRRFLAGLADREVIIVYKVDAKRDVAAIWAYAWIYEGFFGHTFLAYLAVEPPYRRNTFAGMLLREAERRAVTDRVFSSTNASNVTMQSVFDHYGWRRCGQIDELDPGDPEIVYVKYVT